MTKVIRKKEEIIQPLFLLNGSMLGPLPNAFYLRAKRYHFNDIISMSPAFKTHLSVANLNIPHKVRNSDIKVLGLSISILKNQS